MSAVSVPWYYRYLIRLAKPIYRRKVVKKSAHLPTCQRELNERFGEHYGTLPSHTGRGVIWCHAVSLGEINTAYPLLKLLLEQGFSLWITSTTQTGFNRVEILFKSELGQTVAHSFVPVDDGAVVGRFLDHLQPVMALFVETELWATMLSLLKQKGVPSVMINARLTAKSFQGYQRFARISGGMMKNLSLIIAQDRQSVEHFCQLGADSSKVRQADSLKWVSGQGLTDTQQALFDEINASDKWCLERPIWVAGSTHDDEERQILAVHGELLKRFTNAVLILVPRHPERFDAVADLCQEFKTNRRSNHETISEQTQVYLADSMGELLLWYALADAVFVGGSLVDVGGHNPIEPAIFAKPIIMGHFLKNCQLLADELADVGALTVVRGSGEMLPLLSDYFNDPDKARTAGEQGQILTAQKQHAHHQQYQLLKPLLP